MSLYVQKLFLLSFPTFFLRQYRPVKLASVERIQDENLHEVKAALPDITDEKVILTSNVKFDSTVRYKTTSALEL